MVYYKNNLKQDLYQKIYSKFKSYDLAAKEWPSFLKLLMYQLSTTSKAILWSLNCIMENQVIKKNCPKEVKTYTIQCDSELFGRIYFTMDVIRDGNLQSEAEAKTITYLLLEHMLLSQNQFWFVICFMQTI